MNDWMILLKKNIGWWLHYQPNSILGSECSLTFNLN